MLGALNTHDLWSLTSGDIIAWVSGVCMSKLSSAACTTLLVVLVCFRESGAFWLTFWRLNIPFNQVGGPKCYRSLKLEIMGNVSRQTQHDHS